MGFWSPFLLRVGQSVILGQYNRLHVNSQPLSLGVSVFNKFRYQNLSGLSWLADLHRVQQERKNRLAGENATGVGFVPFPSLYQKDEKSVFPEEAGRCFAPSPLLQQTILAHHIWQPCPKRGKAFASALCVLISLPLQRGQLHMWWGRQQSAFPPYQHGSLHLGSNLGSSSDTKSGTHPAAWEAETWCSDPASLIGLWIWQLGTMHF